MTKLSELGFSKGTVAETIVSSYNLNGEPNAAPMGAIMENEDQISINLFNSSLTLKNLQANMQAVLNLTNDIELFYTTTFKETNPNYTLPRRLFGKAKKVNAPKLRKADATIEVSVINMVPISNEKTKTLFKVEQVIAKKTYPQAYCRGFAATLEAIIHATRVKEFINDKKEQEQVYKLLSLIENCSIVVEKVASNSSYSKVMTNLTKKIEGWRNQGEGLH